MIQLWVGKYFVGLMVDFDGIKLRIEMGSVDCVNCVDCDDGVDDGFKFLQCITRLN